MKDKLFAAVDLGGTKIYTVIADHNYNILARKRFATPSNEDADTVIRQIALSVRQILNKADARLADLAAVGVCVPGFFDWKERCVLGLPNVPHVKDIPLERILAEQLGLPVSVENDANAAAVGEARFGAGKGFKDVIFVTVSTGIGAGLVLDDQLYRGSRGFAGEIGHMAVKADGPQCGCGRRGCLEAVSSGTAIAREANTAIKSGLQTVLKKMAEQNGGKVTAAHVFAAAKDGDKTAKQILKEAIGYLGISFVNVINLFNPSILVVGGGVAEAGEQLFSPLRDIIAAHAVVHSANTVTLKKAQLGTEAGVMGMLALLQEQTR